MTARSSRRATHPTTHRESATNSATTPAQPAGTESVWGRTLAEAYNPRSNSMDVLRLAFASLVALAHALAIGYGWQPEVGTTELASFAVDGFFVLSGFLITASFLRLSPGRYLWHRFLRIMPAFWACLILTAAVVAPIVAVLEGATAKSAWVDPNASWRYVIDNFFLYMRNFDVATHPWGTYQPGVINGALWTLFYEAVCYLMVFTLGLIGGLTRRTWLTWAVAVVSAAALTVDMAGVNLPGELFWRFFLIFSLGMLAWIHQDRLRITKPLTVGAVALVLVSTFVLPDYRPLGGIAFAYLCMVVIVATPRLRFRLRADVSYGIYIWHWPMQVILVLAGVATALPAPLYVLASLALATACAWLSWHLLEKRALAAKNYRLAR